MVDPRGDFTRLYTMLVGAMAATKENLAAAVTRCEEFAETLASWLNRSIVWDEELIQRAQSVIVLLDHVGAREQASHLLGACAQATENLAVQARFGNVALLLDARHGHNGLYRLPVAYGNPPSGLQTATNLMLSNRYAHPVNVAGYLGEPTSGGGAIARFALASLAFDNAVYAARLPDARTALVRMEELASSIMTELGEDHPYLGLVLLTLSSAKCGLAAVDGNVQALRHYADVLAIAVQRASAQLGADHSQTIGGMANLAHSEFELALASQSPHEVAQCLHHLNSLAERSERVCGPNHPTVVVLAMNAAVAELESARQERSIARLQRAEVRLTRVAQRAEKRFGLYHPCTAIARSNAAAAGFDLARAERSRTGLEHMVTVLGHAVSQVSDSLGAGHATARALTQQLRACHRLLASDNPWSDGPGGGATTIVRTIEDEMWGFDDDYVPVYEASPQALRSPSGPISDDVNDRGAGVDLLAAIDGAIVYFNDGDIVEGVVVQVDADEVLVDIGYRTEGVIPARELSTTSDVDPADVVSVGDRVEALVLRKEDTDGRLILSRRRAADERATTDPLSRFARTHTVGQIVIGTVTAFWTFGAHVQVAEDVVGLVHISELTTLEPAPPPQQLVRVGDEFLVRITGIDLSRHAIPITLSLRQANEISPDTEFDPTQYGMAAEYDENGDYVYPEGFDGETGEWLEGFERQREVWERRHAEALALHERHMNQVRAAARARETTDLRPSLTNREKEILRLLSAGQTNRSISEALSVSPRTVENHISQLFRKLGVHSRTSLSLYAVRHNISAYPLEEPPL